MIRVYWKYASCNVSHILESLKDRAGFSRCQRPPKKQWHLALLPFRVDTEIQRQRRKRRNWKKCLAYLGAWTRFDSCPEAFTPSMPCGIGSHRVSTLHRHCSRTLGIVTDIARDDEALQAVTRLKNPKCKGMTGRY